ncbi:MAG: peroxiredoxin-like family protein [Hyphomicrobiales bacterium]
MSQKLPAGSKFPEITVSTIDGGELDLGKPAENRDWSMIVVYRGKHCPICTRYLGQLEGLKDEFHQAGVDVQVVSGDPKEKAEAHMADIGVSFPVGYGLSVEQMAKLGLYISDPRSPKETDRPFPEPGLFVINGDGNVQLLDISNGPFARPELQSVLNGLKFIRNPENNYPIRGTHQP